ncbi:hypothetical protein ALI144C_52515 [Actinosynnema sp. ALI-1.44]|uniref:helix-turn-helix domain-containing protein n=1 Tax=Actinosynnema sp. ALI-1.44 TaxID=1933779 RepID=UPI00097CB7EE|nr:helix-turn-helix transcriptional regulator [Actinosynnema sp. ALI-1.44]ONI71154.1 hypothetical protein ALI144C_52515 [Actinosynnema sp. ALI-1.44]
MAKPVPPNHHGRRLARELKRLRELAGKTQAEAGRRLHMSLQKLSRIENGQQPGYHELCAMLGIYDVPSQDRDTLLRLWELARKRGWWREFGLKNSGYVCAEHEASHLVEFQLGTLPALMQTERYAHDSLQYADDPDTAVRIRLRRQQRLFDDNPLAVDSLIHEPVLHQGIDEEQSALLIDRAQMPNVTLRIVPQSAGLHCGLDGSVVLLSFDDPEEPDIAFTKSALGTTQSEDPDLTSAACRRLDQLATLALSPDDTLETLKKLVIAR